MILIQEQLSKNRVICDTDSKGEYTAAITSVTHERKTKTTLATSKGRIVMRHLSFGYAWGSHGYSLVAVGVQILDAFWGKLGCSLGSAGVAFWYRPLAVVVRRCVAAVVCVWLRSLLLQAVHRSGGVSMRGGVEV